MCRDQSEIPWFKSSAWVLKFKIHFIKGRKLLYWAKIEKKTWTRAGNIFGRRSLGIDYPIIIMSRTVFSTFPKLTIHGSLYFFVFWAIMRHIEMWLWIMNLISLSVDINSKGWFLPFSDGSSVFSPKPL